MNHILYEKKKVIKDENIKIFQKINELIFPTTKKSNSTFIFSRHVFTGLISLVMIFESTP